MTKILPTVGRNLYYQPAPGDQEITQKNTTPVQPLHAHILFVHDDRHVTLEVVDHIGNRHVRGDVILLQEGDEVDRGSEYCYWMKYQVGQAKAQPEQEQSQATAGQGQSNDAPLQHHPV